MKLYELQNTQYEIYFSIKVPTDYSVVAVLFTKNKPKNVKVLGNLGTTMPIERWLENESKYKLSRLANKDECTVLDFCLGWVRDHNDYYKRNVNDLTKINIPSQFKQIDSNLFYRGMYISDSAYKKLEENSSLTLKPRKIGSWTTNYKIAEMFADRFGDVNGKTGIIFKKNIPASNVLLNITATMKEFFPSKDIRRSVSVYEDEYEVLILQTPELTTINIEDLHMPQFEMC